MTRIPESSSWEEEIELISRSERVSGGLDGVANRPLKSLANRTRYLKEKAEESGEIVAEKVSAIKTFAEGAMLGSPREEILHGAYRLVWTGEFPKVVPAASSPETTGGVGAGRWAYTSDAAIRSNLSSGDGQKLIGEYSSISELRAATLDYHGQKVKVKYWDMELGTALVNVFYVYDANDQASVDDGYRTIVNAAGQRFKALLNDTLDLRIVGLRSYGDNLGTAFNRALEAELARVFADDSAMKMATIKLPALTSFDDPNVSTYNAILNASIVMPSYTPVECDGNYFCKFNPINDVAI
ncbi:hypothetical protein ACUB1S_006024, partial [Klebsiella michiganensis]